ncbi:unnamed protein product [Triticum turgidum subsp. durum]|uniref:Uncharacterized protein n=2 Tax=Triticum TaxID=4564 RepID=A0A9R0Z7W9_TRITD|nr:unnamed protein product [Triticum turgidum subsp. durum]
MLRDMTPRIGLYDYDLMKKMVDKITVNVGAGEVSYHGATVRTELSVSNLISFPSKETFTAKAAKPAPRRANATYAPMLRSSYTKTGPQEFSNYIRTWYPSISAEKLGILLREQNARGLASISEMRQVFQSNMFTFTDKLMACLADSCTCCKAHGNKKCILEKDGTNTCDAPPHVPTDQTQFSTPLVSKIGPRLPPPGNPAGCLSANSSASRKRDGSLSSSVQSGTAKKTCSREAQNVLAATPTYGQEPLNQIAISQDASLNEIASKIVAFYDNLTAILVTYYAEMRPAPGFILFGSTTDRAHVKIDLPQCNFGRDPWVAGSVPVPPNPTVLRAIRDWMTAASMLNLERKWIMHPKPRLIALEGVEIQRQLASNDAMTHEMATAIFRRLGQIDSFFSKDTPGLIWRKFLEPDFATTVLANADPLTVHSIRGSFQEGTASCNPASCRMWYIPTILPDCWTVYAFDMLRKRIIVFDPTIGPFGYSNRRVSMHEFVSNKLHAALFTCLQNFFSSWHCESSHWGRTFPIIMRENIEKEQTGLCATFFAWNYDGDKLQTPLNKDMLASHSSLMIYELMRMQGNQTPVENDALEAVKGSFIAL